MKIKLLTVIVMMMSLLFSSCAVPTGTPAQKARQTEANAKLGNAIGMAALGAGVALGGVALFRNSGGYGHGGYYGHYRGYRGYYVEPYYNPYVGPFGW